MACNNPLFRFPCLIESVPAQYQKRVRNGAIILSRKEYELFLTKYHKSEDNFQQIPCGQCSACRLEYSRQWAIRCMLESTYHNHCWFVTCTYDDAYLPNSFQLDLPTGELLTNEKGDLLRCLEPDDATKFLKRLRITAERKGLREDDKNDIRYFYCGEYGEKFKRPHFHFLFFGLNIPDLKPLYVKRGNRFFESAWLNKLWGKGFVVIGELTFETCAYTARYVMKKLKGKKRKELMENRRQFKFDENTMELSYRDEFCRMSRRPGLARCYFDEHKDDMYNTDSLYVKTSKGLMSVKPCRYYDSLYDVVEPEKMAEIKQQRKKVGKASTESRRARSSLTDEQYLEQKENAAQERVKKLKREVD